MSWPLKEKLQQTLGKERGAFVFAPGSRSGFALAYPNSYHVAMSNLGFHIIYQQINSRGDTACERVFLPDARTMHEYARTNTPLLTLETQRPLYEFPLIGFAVTFEMDYFNILTILSQGKIELLAAKRSEDDPLVIAGGTCATFNPEPIAEFVDAFIVGEGEEVIHEFLDVYYEAKAQSLPREDTLLKIAQIPGVYVPRFYYPKTAENGAIYAWERHAAVPERITRRWVRDLDAYPGQTVVVTEDTEFKDMFLIEVARGCGRHCRFCMAGYCFRRPRVRSLARLKEAMAEGKQYRNKIGLVGAAVSDYPEIDALSQAILDMGLTMSVASLRADTLTGTLVEALAASGHKTITLAPEAASARMRRVINKGITDEHLRQAVYMAVKAGIPNVRLYIMIGLPFERDEDVEAIIDMALDIKKFMNEIGGGGQLTLSINPFIPKPFTPFQWLPMAPAGEVEAKIRRIQNRLKPEKRIEVLAEPPRESYIQSVLARGDRRLAQVLLAAHRQGGVKGWKRALIECGINAESYLYRERDAAEVLPWQNLDMGLETGYLQDELKKAAEERSTAPCVAGCMRCGVCRKEEQT